MPNRCPACDALTLGHEVYCLQCAAPLISSLPPSSLRMRWLIRARHCLLINSILSIGPACLLVHPLSALAGGPMLILLGLGLAWVGRRATYPGVIRLGLIQAGVPVVYVPIVYALGAWNPRLQVALPFPLALLVLTGVVVFFFSSLCVWRDHPARDLRFHCDHCGYLLTGQITPRCPECGHRFDPARLTH